MRTITLVILGVVILCQQKSTSQPMDDKNKKKEKTTLEQFTKKLKEKQPGWSLTTRLKNEKEDITEIDHNKRIMKKVEVRSYWMVLDGNPIELTKEKNQGGFDVTYGNDERILFKNPKGKWIREPTMSLEKATVCPGLNIFVSHMSFDASQKFLIVPVQKVYEVDDGTVKTTFFGIVTIAEFQLKK